MSLSSNILRQASKAAALSFLLGLGVATASAQQPAANAAPKKELTDKISEELGKLRALGEAGNHDGAIAKIDELLKTVGANSYDRAILNQVKVQELVAKNDYSNLIEPLETALKLSDQYDFFDDKAENEMAYSLAQVYYIQADSLKPESFKLDGQKIEDVKKSYVAKALTYARRWLDKAQVIDPKIEEAQLFVASIVYNQAQVSANEIDTTQMKKAIAEAEKGLLLRAKPKNQFYTIILAALQQLGDYEGCAKILEILVKQDPKNKTYWQQLTATYIQLGQDLKAIVTLERAQSNEVLNSPKENFNMAGIYYNMQQFDYVAEILGNGLQSGAIEPIQSNYELLASAYQQSRKELKAIEALREATRKFPKAGGLDIQISQIYYSIDKYEDAYRYMESGLKKGVDKNAAQSWAFLSYLGLELKRYDDALAAAEKAFQLDPNSKDAKRLLETVKETIKERESFRNSPNR